MSSRTDLVKRSPESGSSSCPRPRVAFLTQNSVLPADNGARIRNAALLHALGSAFQTTVVTSEPVSARIAAELLDMGLRVVHVPKASRRIPGLLSDLVRGIPPLIAVQRNTRLEGWLLRHRAEFDVVIAGTIMRAPRTRSRSLPPVVIDTHNVEFVRYGRARREARAGGRLRQGLWTLGLRRYEAWALRGRVAVACSEADARALRTIGAEDVRVIPNGAWIPAQGPSQRSSSVPRIVFVGDLGYEPNRQAARLLIREIAPLVRRRLPTSQFLIGGRGADPALVSEASERGVKVVTPVADMDAFLADATAEVVPLKQGGGTRLKILEAFARGVPVVSTSVGAEGIDAMPGKHLLIANGASEIAEALLRLHTDEGLAGRLCHSARVLAEERYDWAVLGRDLVALVHDVAGATGAAARRLEGLG